MNAPDEQWLLSCCRSQIGCRLDRPYLHSFLVQRRLVMHVRVLICNPVFQPAACLACLESLGALLLLFHSFFNKPRAVTIPPFGAAAVVDTLGQACCTCEISDLQVWALNLS